MLKITIITSLTLLLKRSIDVTNLRSRGRPFHSVAAECRKYVLPYL